MENQVGSPNGDFFQYSPSQHVFPLHALPTLTCLMFLTNATFDTDGRKNYTGFQLLSISNLSFPNDPQDKILTHLFASKNLFNYISGGPSRTSPTEVLICSEQAQKVQYMLSKFNVPFDILSQDFQKDIDEHRSENDKNLVECGGTMNWKSYQRFDTIQNWMDSMADKYPDVVFLETYGQTTEGRPMRAMRIYTKGGGDEPKPIVWLDGGIHAREWVAVSTVTFIANEIILRAVDGNPLDVINSVDWVIVPNMNPDGYEFSFEVDRMWRKTRSKTPNPRCMGTDPNRNWDFKWGGKSTSKDPCNELYPGVRPASAPEIYSSQKYIYRMRKQIQLFITVHSYSQIILYPWAYADIPTEDEEDLRNVAIAGVEALEAVHGTPFRVGTTPKLIFEASGTSFDWAKAVAGIKFSFTIELRDRGNVTFLLPPNEIIPSGEETFAGVAAMVQSVLNYYDDRK